MGYVNINTCDVTNCIHKSFVIDANALLHVFYPNSAPHYASSYSNFVSRLINNNKTICVPVFTLIEAINVIEKIELKLYQTAYHTNIGMKASRNLITERQIVKNNIKLFLEQIFNIPQIKILSQELDYSPAKSFVDKFDQHKLDCFDFYLEELCYKGSYPIITNDADYTKGIHNVDIYTSSPRILNP